MFDTQYLDLEGVKSYLKNNFHGGGHLDTQGGGNGKHLLLAIPPQEHSFELFDSDILGYLKMNISNGREELSLRVKKPITLSNERVINKGRYRVRVSPKKEERPFVRRFWCMSKDILEAIPSSSLLKGNIEDYCFENRV